MADKRTYVNPATTLLEASNRSRAHLGNISANSGDALQALKDLAYETALNAGPVLAGNQLLGAAERNLGPGGALEVIPGQAWSTIPGTEIGGAIGSAVDTVAGPVLSLASGLARVGIGAVELQNIAPWLMDTARLDVNDIENLAVFQSPRATPEQKAKAWQYMTTKEIPQLIGGPITLDEYYSKASGRADTASTLLNLKQDITDNLDSDYPVRREVRGALDRDAKFHEASQNIQDTVDAKGALSLEYLGAILANSPQLAMSGLGAAADHPLSAVNNVAENSGASLLAAYFGGPAAMAAVSSLQEAPGFLGERLVKGHIAPRKHGVSGVEQTVGLVGTAAAHAAADFAGDLLMAKVGGLLKGAKGTASSPLAALGEASAAKGLGVIPATLKAGIKTVGSIGAEMGTEGIQHDLEQYIRNEPTSATARGEAMALASISAGAISTPGSVLGIARDVALRRGNNQVEGSAFNSHELRALEKARKEAIPNEEALVKAGLMRPLGMQLLIERTHYLDGQIKELGKTANDASATPEERTKAQQALTRVKAELTQHLDLMDGMAAPRIAAGNAAIDTLIAVRDPLAITDPDGNATTYGDMKTRVHAMATDGTSKDVRKRWEDALETKAEELRSVPGVAEAEDAYMKHLADPVLSTIPEFLDSRKKAQVTNTKKAAAKQQMQAKNAAAKAKAATRKMAAKAAKAAKKAAATASPSQGTTAPTSPAIPASGGLVAPGGTTTPIQGQAATSTQGATTPSTPMVTQGPVTPQSAAAAIMGTAASVDPGAIDDTADTADTDDADTNIAPDEQDLTADAKDLEEIIIRNMASLDELVQTAEFQEFYERVKDYLSPGIGALLRESMNLATTTKHRATTLEGTRAQKLTSGGVHARSALHYLKEMLDYLETGVGAKRARNSVVAQRRYADNQAERAQAIKEAHARAKARGYTANEGLLFVVKAGIMEVIQVPVEDGEAGRDAAKAANPDILVIHSGSTRLVAAALEEADSLAAIARALEAVVDTDIKDAAAVAKAKQRLLQGFLEANLEEDMKPLTAINNTSGAPMSLHAARKLLKGKIAEYANALHLLAASEYQDGPAFMLGLLNLVVNTQDTRVISTVLAKNPALNTRVDRRRKSPLFRVRSGVAMLYAWAEINQNANASLNEAGLTALLMAWDQRYGRSLTGNLASEYLQEAPASPITQSSRASRGNAQATPVAGRNAVSGAPVDTQAPQTVIGAPVTQPVAPATPVAPVKPAPVVAAAPAAPAAPAAEAAPATPAATPAATTPPAAPAGKDAGAVAPTKKPVDQITADDWSAIIGYIEGPARPDGSNENIDTDTFLLLKKMVIKIIKDGVKNGTPRERIIQQIEGVTKGGVSNKAMSNIHSLLDAQTVNASAPAAPVATPAVDSEVTADDFMGDEAAPVTADFEGDAAQSDELIGGVDDSQDTPGVSAEDFWGKDDAGYLDSLGEAVTAPATEAKVSAPAPVKPAAPSNVAVNRDNTAEDPRLSSTETAYQRAQRKAVEEGAPVRTLKDYLKDVTDHILNRLKGPMRVKVTELAKHMAFLQIAKEQNATPYVLLPELQAGVHIPAESSSNAYDIAAEGTEGMQGNARQLGAFGSAMKDLQEGKSVVVYVSFPGASRFSKEVRPDGVIPRDAYTTAVMYFVENIQNMIQVARENGASLTIIADDAISAFTPHNSDTEGVFYKALEGMPGEVLGIPIVPDLTNPWMLRAINAALQKRKDANGEVDSIVGVIAALKATNALLPGESAGMVWQVVPKNLPTADKLGKATELTATLEAHGFQKYFTMPRLAINRMKELWGNATHTFAGNWNTLQQVLLPAIPTLSGTTDTGSVLASMDTATMEDVQMLRRATALIRSEVEKWDPYIAHRTGNSDPAVAALRAFFDAEGKFVPVVQEAISYAILNMMLRNKHGNPYNKDDQIEKLVDSLFPDNIGISEAAYVALTSPGIIHSNLVNTLGTDIVKHLQLNSLDTTYSGLLDTTVAYLGSMVVHALVQGPSTKKTYVGPFRAKELVLGESLGSANTADTGELEYQEIPAGFITVSQFDNPQDSHGAGDIINKRVLQYVDLGDIRTDAFALAAYHLEYVSNGVAQALTGYSDNQTLPSSKPVSPYKGTINESFGLVQKISDVVRKALSGMNAAPRYVETETIELLDTLMEAWGITDTDILKNGANPSTDSKVQAAMAGFLTLLNGDGMQDSQRIPFLRKRKWSKELQFFKHFMEVRNWGNRRSNPDEAVFLSHNSWSMERSAVDTLVGNPTSPINRVLLRPGSLEANKLGAEWQKLDQEVQQIIKANKAKDPEYVFKYKDAKIQLNRIKAIRARLNSLSAPTAYDLSSPGYALSADMHALYIGFAAGLGISIDKDAHAASLQELLDRAGWYISTGILEKQSSIPDTAERRAITVLKAYLASRDTSNTPEAVTDVDTPVAETPKAVFDEDALSSLKEAVLSGGLGLETLATLLNMARLERAVEQSAGEVSIYQANAVDGVSNGPSLAQLLVGSLSRITKENFLSVLRAADRHAPSEFNADAPVSVRIRELIKANDRGMASAQDIKLLNDLSALFTRELSDLQKWRDRAGFFKDSPVDVPLADFEGDFNVFRGQQGVQDTYEAVGATLVQGVVKALGLNKKGAPNAPLYSALDTLWGINESTSEASKSKTRTKKYRGLLKNPITQVVYGAGYRAIAVSIGSTLFYEVLEAIQTEEAAIRNATDANIKAQHAARLLELQKVFFTFSPIQNKPHPSDKEIGYTWAELRNSVNGHGMYAYMPAFIDKAGAAIASPVWFVMTTAFNNLIENRRPIQVVNQAGFRGARDSYLYTRTQLLNKQAITEVDGQKVVVNDLTVKQEKILRKLLNHLLPRVGTPAGKFDETSNDGMLISGKRTKVEVSNETVDAGLNSQLTAAMGNWHKIGMPGRIQAIKGRVAVLAAPGVQVLPLPILATDASISHGSLLREDPKTGTTYVAPFFNNHDSHAGDARDIAAQTRELNKNTLHALINYEPMLATLEGALVGLERAFGVIPEDVISQEDLDTLGVTREELAQFARNGFLQSLIDSLFVPNDDAMSATAKSNTVDENQVSINARTTPYNARARIGEIFRDAQGILKGFNAWLTKEGSAPELAALLGESSIDGILQGTLTDALSEKQKGERALILLTAAILRLRMRGIGAMSAKFGEIKEFTYISQYAFEGGAYKVTDADRQEALAALDAQQKKNASMDERLASVMNAMAKALAVYTPVEPVKAIEAASAKDVAPAADTLINLEPEGVPSDSESQNVSVSSATPVSGNERLEAAQVGLKDTEVALTTATEAMVSRAPGLANFYKGLQAFIKAMLTDSNRVQVYALPFSEITTDMLDALGIPPKGHRKIMDSTSNAIVLPSHNIILINAKPGEWAGTTLLHEMLHLVWRRFLLSKPAKAARASDNGFEASMAILRDAVDTLMAMTAEDIKASGLSSTEQTLLKGIQKLLKKHLDSVSKKLTDEGLDEGVVYLLSTPGLLNAVTPHIGKADTGQATAANLQILKGSRTVTTALNALKNVYTAFKDYLARFTKTPPAIVDAVPLAYSYLLGLSMNTALPSLVSENTDVALRNMVDMSDNSYGGMLESQMLADGLDPAFANRVGKTLQQTQEQLFHLQPDTLQARVAFEEALSGQDQNSWNTFIPDGAAEALIGASTLSVAQSELIAINQFESLYRQLLAATTGVGYQFRRQMEAIHQEAVTRYPTAQAMLAVIPNPTQADVDQVNEMHALLFDHGLDGANALARFASLTVGYMDIGYFFEYKAKKPGNPKGTITQRLVHWISQLLTWFESKEGVRTRSGSAQEQLRRALLELMANQIRFKKWQTKRANRKVPRFNKLVTAMSGWTGKALESDWVMKNKFPPVRLVGALYETARDGEFQNYVDKLRELRDMRHPKDPHGFMMRLATEMRGVSNKMLPVFGLFNNMRIMENHRQDTIRDVATASLSAFKAGTSLKKKERSLILDMGLRTGLWRIGEHFNKPSASEVLQEYLQDPAALARDRQAVLASLRSMGATATQLKWYDWHSDHLGYFWATGESYSNYMLGNLEAVLIRGRVEETDTYTPAMIEAVGTLTALYAVEHQIAGLTQQARQVLERLVDTEVSRTDTGDGFQFISRMQKDFDNRTENLYVDDDGDFFWGSMQDNWLPSLTDPDSPMVELSKNLPMHKALYRGVPGLTGTDGKTGLAIGKHNKVADVRSGALVYGRTHIEGARMGIHYGAGQQLAYPNKKVGNSGVNSVLPWLNQVMAAAPAAARKGGKRGNLVFLAKPNTTGNEEHYLQLSHREKRVYQGAVEDFSDVLGAYAGKLFEKEDMLATQLETVKALLKFQEQEPLYKAWVKAGSPPMGPTYKALAASWDLVTSNHFPQKVQEAMGASMWVRRDMVPVVAGERKFSLAERVFNDAKHPDQNALLRAVGDQIVNFLATFKGMPPKVAREFAWQWVHNAGRITKAMVSEIKDRIVVTSVTVFVGNTLSNLYHLVNTGVPFKTILRGYILGHQAATQYRRDFAEVEQLRYQVAVGVSDKPLAETQRKLAVVQARLQNNPVGRYIQAGLLPSIVEDIAVTEAGHFDLRNKARDKVRGYIPTKIRGVANEVFMQPGSQVYQGLNTLTQLSDFSARVALMEHWKETKDARPFNDQVLWAMNEFVWYDLPSDTRLEWANEVGLVMFSKYFLRVQKVLAELILRHPVRTLTMGLFDSLILDIPDAMESLMGVSEMPWDVLGSSVFNADEILTGGAIVDTLL